MVLVGCGNCGAQLASDGQAKTSTCVYCASPNVVERAAAGVPPPSFVLGFSIGLERARSLVRTCLRNKRIERTAKVSDLFGVYVPAYAYGALANTRWSAQIGESYEFGTGEQRSIETEWFPLQGEHATWIVDVIVSASRGVTNGELESVEPFDLRKLRRYDPSVVSGWIAEEAAMPPESAASQARGESLGRVGQALTRLMPGDKHRELQHQTVLDRETADLLYVPLFIAVVADGNGGAPVRVIVNGQTGKIWAPLKEKPPSAWALWVFLAVLVTSLVLAVRACTS